MGYKEDDCCTFRLHACSEVSTLISACGFGMRVMGGRRNTKGTLGAFVTMVVPDGPADTQGIQIGTVLYSICII